MCVCVGRGMEGGCVSVWGGCVSVHVCVVTHNVMIPQNN